MDHTERLGRPVQEQLVSLAPAGLWSASCPCPDGHAPRESSISDRRASQGKQEDAAELQCVLLKEGTVPPLGGQLEQKIFMTTVEAPERPLVEVYLARRSDLRMVASKIVGRPDQVDDVLQDAYLKLVDGVCAREVQNPFGYCCQVVRNTALDYCRRRVVEGRCIVSSPDGDLPEVEGGKPADAGLDERRMLVRIEAALAELPPRTRLVFELYRLEGKTQREIAKIVGVSATLVNFMIRDVMTALAACRDILEG